MYESILSPCDVYGGYSLEVSLDNNISDIFNTSNVFILRSVDYHNAQCCTQSAHTNKQKRKNLY